MSRKPVTYYIPYEDIQDKKKKKITVSRSLEKVMGFCSRIGKAEKCKQKRAELKRKIR